MSLKIQPCGRSDETEKSAIDLRLETAERTLTKSKACLKTPTISIIIRENQALLVPQGIQQCWQDVGKNRANPRGFLAMALFIANPLTSPRAQRTGLPGGPVQETVHCFLSFFIILPH